MLPLQLTVRNDLRLVAVAAWSRQCLQITPPCLLGITSWLPIAAPRISASFLLLPVLLLFNGGLALSVAAAAIPIRFKAATSQSTYSAFMASSLTSCLASPLAIASASLLPCQCAKAVSPSHSAAALARCALTFSKRKKSRLPARALFISCHRSASGALEWQKCLGTPSAAPCNA